MSRTDDQLNNVYPKHIEAVLVPVGIPYKYHTFKLSIHPPTGIANAYSMSWTVIDLTDSGSTCA